MSRGGVLGGRDLAESEGNVKVRHDFMSQIPHPMQPIGLDDEGRPRFKANAVVRWLVDSGRLSLNDVPDSLFSRDDLAQFWQLLGYSVSGYGELSFIPDDIKDKADEIASDVMEADADLKKFTCSCVGLIHGTCRVSLGNRARLTADFSCPICKGTGVRP